MSQQTQTLSTLTLQSVSSTPAHRALAAHAGGLSAGAIAVAVLAALLALACLAWLLARTFAFEPRWTLTLRHAVAEAELRTSATWAELCDWIRLGR
jgi:hypothetical protein